MSQIPWIELIISAILGAVCSYFLPKIIFSFKIKNKSNLSGNWKAKWQPQSKDFEDWVTEDMNIRYRLDVLIFVNSNNSKGYEYKCKGKMLRNNYILGEWASTKHGATAAGGFILTLSPQGNFIYGYMTGPNNQGIIKSSKFILGRTDEDVVLGEKQLQ